MKELTNEEILKADFDSLSEQEQERFYDLSEEKIKEKYGKIIPKNVKTHTIVLENGMGGILRHPNPTILSKAMGALSSINGDPDMYKAGNHILDNCWACGDKEVLNDESLRFSAALQACSLVQVMQGRIKKN